MVRVTSLLIIAASALGFSFGVRAQTEIKIWCVVGMHMLKVVNLGVKGLINLINLTALIGSPDVVFGWILRVLEEKQREVHACRQGRNTPSQEKTPALSES